MIFRLSLLLISLLLLISFSSKSQSSNKKNRRSFKVIGYYPLPANNVLNDSDYSFLDKVTHVNLAFINPDTSGNFINDLAIDSLVNIAHAKNVKVLASIAGGGPHLYYSSLLKDDKRPMFIKNLILMVEKYKLDGIDVDLEGGDIDVNYENFVTELHLALKAGGKLMTAAIATGYKDKLSDKALQQFDFLNIMSYDRTGPWNPSNAGQHSPVSMAEEDLEYWHNQRLIPKERLVLGLPFYGYGFSSSDKEVTSMSYKDIVAASSGSVSADSLTLPDQRVVYYNGAATIKKKTLLAVKKASGVMIWQIRGDAEGENSLLQLIDDTINKK